MNPDVIVVNIPAQTYYDDVYVDNRNCYLAVELRKQFDDVSVGALGESEVDGDTYEPFERFEGELLEAAFAEGKGVEVILLKI